MKKEIEKSIPRLQKSLATSDSPDRSAAIAQVLKILITEGSDDLELNLAILKGVRFQLQPESKLALEAVSQNLSAGDKVIPVLVDLLRNLSLEKQDSPLVLKSLIGFKQQLQPYITRIRSQLAGSEKLSPENLVIWNDIVCSAFPISKGAKARRVVFGEYEKIESVTCR